MKYYLVDKDHNFIEDLWVRGVEWEEVKNISFMSSTASERAIIFAQEIYNLYKRNVSELEQFGFLLVPSSAGNAVDKVEEYRHCLYYKVTEDNECGRKEVSFKEFLDLMEHAYIVDSSAVHLYPNKGNELCAMYFKARGCASHEKIFSPFNEGLWEHLTDKAVIEGAEFYPRCLRTMVIEEPSIGNGMVSYKNEKGKKVEARIGRYFRRHLPRLNDAQLKELVEELDQRGELHFARTLDEMIDVVEKGPGSCMQGKAENDNYHPYRVYNPDYGWAVAYYVQDEKIVARALVIDKEYGKYYVSTYSSNESSGRNQPSTRLEAALRLEGFTKENSFEGEIIDVIRKYDDAYVMPYIDGDCSHVEYCHHSSGGYFEIVRGGEICADSADGTLDIGECFQCNSLIGTPGENMFTTYGGESVCYTCRGDHYVYAETENGEELVPDDETTLVYTQYGEQLYYEPYAEEAAESGELVALYDNINFDYAQADLAVKVPGLGYVLKEDAHKYGVDEEGEEDVAA